MTNPPGAMPPLPEPDHKRELNRLLNKFAVACTFGDDNTKRMAVGKELHAFVDGLIARVAELQAERDRIERNRDMWKGQCEQQAEHLSGFHLAVPALEKDAERYRLVRRGQHWSVIDGIGNTLRADELDKQVDAAIAAKA